MKKYLLILIALVFHNVTTAQDSSYTIVTLSSLVRNANMSEEAIRLVLTRNLQFLFDSYAGYLEESKTKKEKEQATIRLDALNKNFETRGKFPDTISSGWHSVVLTDNNQFCKDASVLVSNNTIRQLVIEDCIRYRCTSKEPITNAKAIITLTDIRITGDRLVVYFINDLDSSSLIDEPMQPGYVCFWTSKFKYLNERLLIDGIRRDLIFDAHPAEPRCLQAGVSFYIMKPGKHHFRATQFGNDKEFRFIVKSGMCLKYELK